MGHPRALNRPRRVVLQDVRSLRTAYMAAELFPPQTGFLTPFSHAGSGLYVLTSCARALPVAEYSPFDLGDRCSPFMHLGSRGRPGCVWSLPLSQPFLVLLWTSPHLSSRASLSLECLRRALQPVLESEWVTNFLR